MSSQSGIVRNIPTQLVRIPASTYLSDGSRTYLAAPVPLQLLNSRLINDNQNDREVNLRRLIESENQLRNLLRLVENGNQRYNSYDDNNRYNSINDNNRFNLNNDNNQVDSNDDRQDRIRDLLRARNDNNYDDDVNRRQNTLNRNQLRALLSSNQDSDNQNNRNQNQNRNQQNQNKNRLIDDLERNDGLSRLRDLSDLNRSSNRN